MIAPHEPALGWGEVLKLLPERSVCRLSLEVLLAGDSRSSACITDCWTSLGPKGDAQVAAFSEEHDLEFMRSWEARRNPYLVTGERLQDPRA